MFFMRAGNGKETSDIRVPEQVRNHAGATLKQVMAAGDVARATWRLLIDDECGHRAARVQLGQWREDALLQQAAGAASRVVDQESHGREAEHRPDARDEAQGLPDAGR